MMSPPQKTALVIGASGYIGFAVARSFAKASYLTLGLIRSNSSDPHGALAAQNIHPIIGSAEDIPTAVASIQAYSKRLDVIVISTDDRSPSQQDTTVELLITLARLSKEQGVKPLVIVTSGCKDYGPGDLDGASNLQPHTEETPLNVPPTLAPRTDIALTLLKYPDLFDAVATRPTNVHGYSSSWYGEILEFALIAKERGIKLKLPGDPRTIMHSLHVDDCGDAYLALAEHPDRSQISGQVFNISPGQKYETLADIASALEKEFELEKGVECVPEPLSRTNLTFAWSQWVGSEKIREVTGWTDSRPMFAEGMGMYRKEYEEAKRDDDVAIRRLKPRVDQSIKANFPVMDS